jgi:outer membrane protein OmpA-like peptidoglycan-associated protein
MGQTGIDKDSTWEGQRYRATETSRRTASARVAPTAEDATSPASAYSASSRYTRVDVDGNTDTSGTPTYNQGLSERRARTVAAELVRDGVPQAAISTHAYGDTRLLVPAGPDVREPQNRRVDIVFH